MSDPKSLTEYLALSTDDKMKLFKQRIVGFDQAKDGDDCTAKSLINSKTGELVSFEITKYRCKMRCYGDPCGADDCSRCHSENFKNGVFIEPCDVEDDDDEENPLGRKAEMNKDDPDWQGTPDDSNVDLKGIFGE